MKKSKAFVTFQIFQKMYLSFPICTQKFRFKHIIEKLIKQEDKLFHYSPSDDSIDKNYSISFFISTFRITEHFQKKIESNKTPYISSTIFIQNFNIHNTTSKTPPSDRHPETKKNTHN